MNRVIPILVGIIMIAGAFGHIVTPELYSMMIPPFIPDIIAHAIATITESFIGITLLVPSTRNKAGLAFLILMVIFLPIHIWDAFKDIPAVGSKLVAIIRIFIQFLLIYTGWWIYKLPLSKPSDQ